MMVDKPGFLDILNKAEAACDPSHESTCRNVANNVSIFTASFVIVIVISSFVVLVSFFGCCGAVKEDRCMLGAYFVITLALLGGMLAIAILHHSGAGGIVENIRTPLLDELKKYNDQPESLSVSAETVEANTWKTLWNQVQAEVCIFAQLYSFIHFSNQYQSLLLQLKCCGVDNYTDWQQDPDTFNFADTFNKPEGCCMFKRDNIDISGDEEEVKACRRSTNSLDMDKFYFNGCYTAIQATVAEHETLLVGIVIGVMVVMVLNITGAAALCFMMGNK